jgi:ATP-dependent helicase/nuclease subunit A
VLRALLPHIRRFTLEWAEERRRTGRLHYHDLLVLARRLLWRDAAVRVELSERWRVLLIDEFQDTDPLQVEIAFALAARDPHHLPARWEEIDLAPGRILVVGDPKQSIYGFRGADITLWNRARARFEGGHVTLHQNFRSLDTILAWVNRVFDDLIGEGDGDRQPPYVSLAPSRTSLEERPDVIVLGGPDDGARADAVRLREAADVAAVIRALHADADRGLRHDDVAILVPTRSPIGQLERALDDADIPYRIESRSLVWSTDVVRDLLAVLQAVDDPADEVAVVAALRSVAFACTDADLLTWRAAGGRWDHSRSLPEEVDEAHPVLGAMRTLRRWHDERHWHPVDALVETVVAERRLVALTMAQRRPRDHWRRLRFLVDQARAFVEAGGATLAQFLAWTELQTSERAAAVETVVPEPDDDAVRISTVHGAKGLEFPVVVLAGLSSGRPPMLSGVLWADEVPEVMLTAEGGGGLAFATDGWDRARAEAKDFDAAEALRLLYVATTRARDQLVVSLHHSPRVDSHARRIHALGELGGTWVPPAAGDETLPFTAPVEAPPARTAGERAAWIARWRAAVDAARRPWSVSPTGLAALAAPAEPGPPPAAGTEADDDSGPPEPAAGGDDETPVGTLRLPPRGGTAVGRAVHAVLESVPLDGTGPVPEATVRALAGAAAAAESVEAVDPGQVADLASSALRSAALAEARASGRHWREVPVVVPVGGHLLEGFVDLLYERPDGSLVVVDWKTDRGRTAAEVDAALDRYRLQGAGYAAALIGATGRSVAEVRFVFCRPGGEPAVERTVADLVGAVADVEALLG